MLTAGFRVLCVPGHDPWEDVREKPWILAPV